MTVARPALRALGAAILRRDPRLDLAAPVAASAPAPPAQLPHTPRTFAARERELARLDAALAAMDGPGTALVTIHGTAGVGKTTLAVRWARTVAGSFPDCQLYVNLRGFDPAGQVVRPSLRPGGQPLGPLLSAGPGTRGPDRPDRRVVAASYGVTACPALAPLPQTLSRQTLPALPGCQ